MGLKDIYRKLLNISSRVFGATFTKKFDARVRFQRRINLNNPTTLADKLCWMELNRDEPLKIKCTDKYDVRDYVKEKGLEDILVPLCVPVCSHIEEIDFDSLPNQFAMKATHGCGMNFICEDKSKYNKDILYSKAKDWLENDYGRACIELHYKRIPHRLIFEKFLQDADKIIDYKIHCFHGNPDFILVCGNRLSGVQKKLYTLNWQPINEMIGKEKGECEFKKPEELPKMLEISKVLSKDFDFVRVDLYDINGKIYFGELTFSPASGVLPNFSENFIMEKGQLLNIMQ